MEGWRGHYTWSVGLVESWKIKSVQFPGDTLSDLATPFFLSFLLSLFLFCFVDRRRREKGEKIFILESRDFEYLADKKRILIHDFELSVMIRQSLDYESLKRDKSFSDLMLLKMRLF